MALAGLVNALRPFHIRMRARPAAELLTRAVLLEGVPYRGVILPPDAQSVPMDASFEEAVAALETQPRLHVEPDGSFVWVSAEGERPVWQLDGVLYDREDRLVHVELKGTCPRDKLADLVAVFHRPDAILCEIVQQGVFLEQGQMWLWLAATPSSPQPPLN